MLSGAYGKRLPIALSRVHSGTQGGDPMAGQATLLQVLWTFWLLAGLSLLPRPLPFFLVPAFFVSMACCPWQADHVTWRAFLMMWLTVHIVFAAAAIRASRHQALVLAASAVGLLWIGFQGGGSYGWYAAHGLLAVLAAALLILIGTGMMLLFSEHRIVIRRQAEESRTLARTDQPAPESDAEPTIVPGFDSAPPPEAAPPEPAQPEPAQPEPAQPEPDEDIADWGFDLFRDEPDHIDHPGTHGPGSRF
jgi:hypothetical protein